jgi:hypothetical protein
MKTTPVGLWLSASTAHRRLYRHDGFALLFEHVPARGPRLFRIKQGGKPGGCSDDAKPHP